MEWVWYGSCSCDIFRRENNSFLLLHLNIIISGFPKGLLSNSQPVTSQYEVSILFIKSYYLIYLIHGKKIFTFM